MRIESQRGSRSLVGELTAVVTSRDRPGSQNNKRGRDERREPSRGRVSDDTTRGSSPKRQKSGLVCYFCNGDGHTFQTCTLWQAWRDEDPQVRKKLCAKCHRGKDSACRCRQERGVYWDTPYMPKKKNVVTLVATVLATQQQRSPREPEEISEGPPADVATHAEPAALPSPRRRPQPAPKQPAREEWHRALQQDPVAEAILQEGGCPNEPRQAGRGHVSLTSSTCTPAQRE